MELAFATGRGPALLSNIEGRGRLVRDEDTVAFAFRDAAEQAEYGSQPLPEAMLALDLPSIRRMGVDAAAAAAVRRLVRPELDGFFIHLDADCLSDTIMAAVDYRQPDGLTTDELMRVLKRAMDSGGAVGLEITIYNPRLDATGAAGSALTDVLVKTLRDRSARRERGA
jgi:arginase